MEKLIKEIIQRNIVMFASAIENDTLVTIPFNNTVKDMSTWLEGEVPTVEEIEKVILLESNLDVYGIHKLAKAMHAMLAHKLTGSGK